MADAYNSLQKAVSLYDRIVSIADIEPEYRQILRNKLSTRRKELDERKTSLELHKKLKSKKNKFNVISDVRVVLLPDGRGQIIVENENSKSISFTKELFSYIWHLALKHNEDCSMGKNHLKIGWLKDRALKEDKENNWESIQSVITARRRVKKKLKRYGLDLIENALIDEHGTKGFRISSPHVIIEEKSLER